MHITFGFIYYFVILMVILSALLFLAIFPKVRKLLLRLSRVFDIADNHLIISFIYFSFSLLLAVLVDSVWSFCSILEETDFDSSSISIQDYQQTEIASKEAYLSLFRKHRDFYISERNLMLAASCLFIYFAFFRFVTLIIQYAAKEEAEQADKIKQQSEIYQKQSTLEQQQQKSQQKKDFSKIPQKKER